MSVTQITTRSRSPRTIYVMVTYEKSFASGPLKGRTFSMAEALPWEAAANLLINEGRSFQDAFGSDASYSDVRIQADERAREALGTEVFDLLERYRNIASELDDVRQILGALPANEPTFSCETAG